MGDGLSLAWDKAQRKVVCERDGQAVLKISNSEDRELTPNGLLIDDYRYLLASDQTGREIFDIASQREGNFCADGLARLHINSVQSEEPEFITSLLFSDLVGLALPPRLTVQSSPFSVKAVF